MIPVKSEERLLGNHCSERKDNNNGFFRVGRGLAKATFPHTPWALGSMVVGNLVGKSV